MTELLGCFYVQSDHMTSPGRRAECHDHHELIYAIRGTYRAEVERQLVTVEPTSYVLYPAGTHHQPRVQPDYFTTIIAMQWNGPMPTETVGPYRDHGGRLQRLLELLTDIRSATIGDLHQQYLATVLAEISWQARGGEATDDRIERIRRFLDEWPGHETSIDFLCGRFDIARSTLQREFRQRTGLSPITYLQRSRARRAADLLRDGQDSVAVADAVAVKTVPALSRLLAKVLGQGIREIRREGRH